MEKTKMQYFIQRHFPTRALVLIPIAVGINLIGGTLCSTLKLPLFLDMIGTVLIAWLSGAWVAALCGLVTNLFLAIVTNPVFLPYSIVSVLCGLVTGYLVKIGLFRKGFGLIAIWLAITLTNTISASLITIFVYGGATGINSSSLVTAAFIATTKEIVLSVFSTSMLENLVDKGLVILIAYWLIKKIPLHFANQYAPLDNDPVFKKDVGDE